MHGTPGDQTIQLDWIVNAILPTSSTWTINYQSPGSVYLPITGLTNTLRAHTLTGLTNYEWYTVTLSAVGTTPILSDTVKVMPTDIFIYLPLVMREN
ncbi:MAG: hypothetical protein GVY30_00530 [Chloroflexi bacterium]|nr:hypothetical protein [Chloroflexota bacterium]